MFFPLSTISAQQSEFGLIALGRDSINSSHPLMLSGTPVVSATVRVAQAMQWHDALDKVITLLEGDASLDNDADRAVNSLSYLLARLHTMIEEAKKQQKEALRLVAEQQPAYLIDYAEALEAIQLLKAKELAAIVDGNDDVEAE